MKSFLYTMLICCLLLTNFGCGSSEEEMKQTEENLKETIKKDETIAYLKEKLYKIK